MKKNKIIYTDEPLQFGQIMPGDFLPSTEEFRRARLEKGKEHVSVTLSLSKDVVDKVKQVAGKKKISYKTLLQALISSYTRQRFGSAS